MRVPPVEAEATHPCGSDRDPMQKPQPHHRPGRAVPPVVGAPSSSCSSSSWTTTSTTATTGTPPPPSPSRRAYVSTASLVVVTCTALAFQIQFFRTAHLASSSASSLRDLRRDVIHFDPPNALPPEDASVAAPRSVAGDQSNDAAARDATRPIEPADPSQPRPAAASSATDPPLPPKLRAEARPHQGGPAGPQEAPSSAGDPTHLSSVSRARELLQAYDVPTQVSPLWNCSALSKGEEYPDHVGDGDGDGDDTASNKLVFVHVYKTAGSSMRDFLRWYGLRCRKSVSIVYRCSHVDVATLSDAVWRDRKHRSCKLSSGATSDGREYTGGAFGRDLYHVSDLVGGHLPLGVHRNPDNGTTGRIQHLTFVRDPLDKYVSGRLYANRRRNWTVDDAVSRISNDISHLARKGGHYEKYSSYLLTPAQKAINLTNDERVEAMQSNLATMNVLVGVVERMDESYQMIQRVLDASGALDRAFALLRDSRLVRNRSTLSTSDVVRRLHARDPDFDRKARLVLRAEYDVYDFAVKLHEIQYDRLVLRNNETQRALPAR